MATATDTYRVDKSNTYGSLDLRALTEDRVKQPVAREGHVDLTEDEAKELKAAGVKLTKLNEDDAKKVAEQRAQGTQDILTKRGADQTDPGAVLAAKEAAEAAASNEGQQQESQKRGSTEAKTPSEQDQAKGSGDSSAKKS